MKGHVFRSGKITVFPLLFIAIVALIAAQIARFVFARELFNWETNIVEALGFNAATYRIGCGILFLAVLTTAFVRSRKNRRIEANKYFSLPDMKK